MRETDSRFRAPLRIGVADGISQPKLSECLIRWRMVAPEVLVELTEMRVAELMDTLRREELDTGFSFDLPDDAAISQQPAWRYPAMALLPFGHKLALQPILPITEVLAFPLLHQHADRLPGLQQQIRAVVQRHTKMPTFAGGACTLSGYFTRIAAGMGMGLSDAGHVATLCRSDIVAVPSHDDERFITFWLHKQQRFGLPDALQRFVVHAHQFVDSAVVTAANEHDKHPLPDLLHGQERRVYAESVYASQKKLIAGKGPEAKDFPNQRTRRNGVVDEALEAKSRNKTRIRSRMEHVFGVVKRLWGFGKVRYRGLAKNATRAFTALALANIYLSRSGLMAQVRP